MQQPLRPFVAETPSSAGAGPLDRAGPIDRADAGLSFDEQLQESSLAASTEQVATAQDIAEPEPFAAEIAGNILPPEGSRSPPDGGVLSPGIPNTGIPNPVDSDPLNPDSDGAGSDKPSKPGTAAAGTPPGGHPDIDVPVATSVVSVPSVTDAYPRTNVGIAESVAVPNSGSPATAASGSTGSGVRVQTATGATGLPAQVASGATIASQPAVAATVAEVSQGLPPGELADRQQRAAANIEATRRRESVTDGRTGGGGGPVDSKSQSKAAGAPLAPPTRGELPVQRIGVENAASNPRTRLPENLPTQVAEASSALPRQTPATDSLPANRRVPTVADRRGPPELPGVSRSDYSRSDYLIPGTESPGNRRADSVGRFVAELQEASMLSGDAHKAKPPSALLPASAQSAPVTSTVAAPVYSSAAAPAPQTASPVFTVNAPVLDPAWEVAINDRLVWLAGRNIPSAEIRLNPADLGPLQVQLSVDEKSVNVTFNAAHPVTREALESALPRLKDMLLENGMSLEGASVSDHGIGHEQNGGGQSENASASEWLDDNDLSAGTDQPLQQRTRDLQGLVDTYA